MAISPMMEKYLETKKEYPGCLLFYRLGDFYELFFEDAELASKELGLTLTGKDCGLEKRAPMCGVPYHAVDTYLTKLVSNGHKVAIAEQMEDPKFAKGLVKREVIRVVTPGTNLDAASLDESRSQYLMSVCYDRGHFGIAFSDVTTGEFTVTEVSRKEELLDILFHISPAEIICNEPFLISGIDVDFIKDRISVLITSLENRYFREEQTREVLTKHFEVSSVESLGIHLYPSGVLAGGALLSYLLETQKNELKHIQKISVLSRKSKMILDFTTKRNLELSETMRDKSKKGTLLWVLDATKTAMGARLLHQWVEEPLLEKKEILARQEVVRAFVSDPVLRAELREYLNPIYDLERLLGRISYQTANPKDLIAFSSSVKMIAPIRELLQTIDSGEVRKLSEELDPMEEISDLIDAAISEDAPILVHEGNLIREGYHKEVDELRSVKRNAKEILAKIEEEEREKTGIKSLRIRYNKVFGYYIEVTNSYLKSVPDYFVRKQTLTGSERFITPQLKELEDKILGAEERIHQLEYQLFMSVRDTVGMEIERIQRNANAISHIDALQSLAKIADDYAYVCPEISENGEILIQNGRHPVIEKMNGDHSFVPNDSVLDSDQNRILVITGPNMAGKSTYMRQTALITLMAQMGSFVPATKAKISICDRIFTRVGASDDLSGGQSTFMVEMVEVANILKNATSKSLLILDEIGRGTSTFDGMSLAWAILEYIANPKKIGAKTLFATHYHELTELEGQVSGIVNYSSAVKEQGGAITFLRKVVRGSADQSYGIHVARLAGVPNPVLERAEELVRELVDTDIGARAKELAKTAAARINPEEAGIPKKTEENQLTFRMTLSDPDILEEIRNLDTDNLTPMKALETLVRIQKELKNRV